MWYSDLYRRHLCDMHIDDWDDSFLSMFSPEEYVENLKRAKIQNAMIYFQSHVGLCYYPTKSGRIHNGFIGKEDAMRRLVDLCHKEGISVTGYYSLIHNTWAHDNYPDWRMLNKNGVSLRNPDSTDSGMEFAGGNTLARHGLCCPNNMNYREFVAQQIKEMSEYFSVDGMFYDMLYWPCMCCCGHCRKRWADEVGTPFPTEENWNDKGWLLLMEKHRTWMGEFAQWVTDITKELFGNVSVEHNVAYSALPGGKTANCEEVIAACDYAGGDLYRGIYSQSFACKFYRNITKNQPFEYMFSRCAPNLGAHTQIKSKDVMRSALFLTAANHGATLVIDAIDPVGTMDSRVYNRIGEVFEELIPYEPYLIGEAVEDIGLYYSLKSKFNPRGEIYTNYLGVTNVVESMIAENILCGVTGGFHDINKYKILVAPALTDEDTYDNKRIIDYVKNGGCLYLSGADNSGLLREFFGAEVKGYTKEEVVYIAPEENIQSAFDYFNENAPLNFEASAPIVEGINADSVLATITLPYTHQKTMKFASIHSNPPGIRTVLPAMAMTSYGKGKVLWSALSIEAVEQYDYKRIFINLMKQIFGFKPTIISDAPKDVEITLFKTQDAFLLSTVLLNTDYKARRVEDFKISAECDKTPKGVCLLPDGKALSFETCGNKVTFLCENSEIFNMYKIIF